MKSPAKLHAEIRTAKKRIASLEEQLRNIDVNSLHVGLKAALDYLTSNSFQGGDIWAALRTFKHPVEQVKARQRLPELRTGITRKFKIPRPEKASRADERASIVAWLSRQGGDAAALAARVAAREHGSSTQGQPLKMWVTINTYPDGRPGEIFIKADKTGSLASGALDAVAIALSMAWQHGVPFESTMEKFIGFRFEPNGITGDVAYPIVASALDYIARWALDKFRTEE